MFRLFSKTFSLMRLISPLLFQTFNFYRVVFFSNLSVLAYSDIIVLHYIVNGQQVSKLKGNETISLKLSTKLKGIKKNQVSQAES